MSTLLGIGLANAVMAAVLAVLAAVVGRVWRKPALRHGLWLLVLLKLVTPPLLPLPILPWKVEEEPVAVAAAPAPPAPDIEVVPLAAPPAPMVKKELVLSKNELLGQGEFEVIAQADDPSAVVETGPPAEAYLVLGERRGASPPPADRD